MYVVFGGVISIVVSEVVSGMVRVSVVNVNERSVNK